MTPLFDYLATKPRGTAMAIAKQIGAYPADFSRWVSGKRPVPVEFCVAIEKATFGAVTRQSLYGAGWQNIWPEREEKKCLT